MKGQQGFLTLTAIVIIVLFAILSGTLVSMAIRSSTAIVFLDAANKAGYLAESALEQGRKNLTEAVMANRQTCVALSNTTTMTTGHFTVVSAHDPANVINPRYAFSSLAVAIPSSSNPSTITVNDASVFAPYGRVMISREVFQYDRIADATTLAGVTRAQDGSMPTQHLAGHIVSQYQCTMEATGSSPASHPSGIRQYRQGIQQPIVLTVGENGTILRWNLDTAELIWQSLSASYHFNAVSMLNYHDVWAVADRRGGRYRLARLQGGRGNQFGVKISPAANLYGVHATSAQEAWAVGKRAGGKRFSILRWVRNVNNDDDNWCRLPCSGKTIRTSGKKFKARSLCDVKTFDTNGDGYADVGGAVGGRGGVGAGNRGLFMVYDGAQWSNLDLPNPSRHRIGQLYGIDAIPNGSGAPKDIYLVGRSSQNKKEGKLIRYRDGAWLVVTTPRRLRSVSVIDTNADGYADFGVAVGDGGVAYTFNFNSVSGPFTISEHNLTGVVVLSPTDVWVVGENGTRLHYNGSTVESIDTGVSTHRNLNGVAAVFSKQTPIASWYDVIH